MGLSPAIDKLYLISKLKLLESLDKMVKLLMLCCSHKSASDLR